MGSASSAELRRAVDPLLLLWFSWIDGVAACLFLVCFLPGHGVATRQRREAMTTT